MLLSNQKFNQYDWVVFSSLFSHAFILLMLPVILLPVSNELGFSLAEGGFADGGLIQVFTGITSIAAILCSGFITHKIGMKRTFILALTVLLIGFILISIADTYILYTCATMIAGGGGAIVVCLAPAIAHDLHPANSGKYISIANSFWSAGMFTTVILSGYLLNAGWSWRSIVIIAGITVILPLFLLIIPNRHNISFPESNEKLSINETLEKKISLLMNKEFYRYVILLCLVSGAEMSLEMWTASYVQLNLNGSATAGGFAVGCFSIGMIISRFSCGYIVKQHSIKNFLRLIALFAAAAAATIPFIESLNLFYIMLFICGLGAAPMWPYVQSYSIDNLKNEDKTVLLILLTVAGFFGFSFFSWFSGMLATHFNNLNIVYYIAPINYLIFIIILSVNKKKNHFKAF